MLARARRAPCMRAAPPVFEGLIEYEERGELLHGNGQHGHVPHATVGHKDAPASQRTRQAASQQRAVSNQQAVGKQAASSQQAVSNQQSASRQSRQTAVSQADARAASTQQQAARGTDPPARSPHPASQPDVLAGRTSPCVSEQVPTEQQPQQVLCAHQTQTRSIASDTTLARRSTKLGSWCAYLREVCCQSSTPKHGQAAGSKAPWPHQQHGGCERQVASELCARCDLVTPSLGHKTRTRTHNEHQAATHRQSTALLYASGCAAAARSRSRPPHHAAGVGSGWAWMRNSRHAKVRLHASGLRSFMRPAPNTTLRGDAVFEAGAYTAVGEMPL